MKRFCILFIAALVTFSLGLAASITTTYFENSLQVDQISQVKFDPFPCAPETVVPEELGKTVELSVLEATCDGNIFSGRMVLENRGPKALRGYEIEIMFDRADPSQNMSQGQSALDGVLLAAGQLKIFHFEVGYGTKSKSRNMKNGSLRKPLFVISQLEYTDGTIWQADPQR